MLGRDSCTGKKHFVIIISIRKIRDATKSANWWRRTEFPPCYLIRKWKLNCRIITYNIIQHIQPSKQAWFKQRWRERGSADACWSNTGQTNAIDITTPSTNSKNIPKTCKLPMVLTHATLPTYSDIFLQCFLLPTDLEMTQSWRSPSPVAECSPLAISSSSQYHHRIASAVAFIRGSWSDRDRAVSS